MSREEAVALGEGVTAGRLCVRGWSVFATLGHDSTHPITAVAHCYGPADAHLFAAAPRLRETVVGLHDRVAELTAENERLLACLLDQIILPDSPADIAAREQRHALLPELRRLPNRRADICTDADAVRKMLDALPPGISRQSGEARLAEVEREIAECGP